MALTSQQKNDVVYYLGWPGAVLDVGSTDYNSIFNNRLNGISEATENRVKRLLGKLETQDERLDGANDRVTAKQIDTIQINPEEIRELKKERCRLVNELAMLLNIPAMKSGGIMFGVSV